MFVKSVTDGVEVYNFTQIDERGFRTFVTGRYGGVSKAPFSALNTDSSRGDEKNAVSVNMGKIRARLGVASIITPIQVHGEDVALVDKTTTPDSVRADAIVTCHPNITIAVRTADCLPIIITDPVSETAGVVHAGRRGTERKIVSKTIRYMVDNFGVHPENVHIALAPCIRACCYEVDKTTADRFHCLCPGDDTGQLLDIVSANIRQIIALGVPHNHLIDCGVCVCCENHRFYSHRKDGAITGRFITGVTILR